MYMYLIFALVVYLWIYYTSSIYMYAYILGNLGVCLVSPSRVWLFLVSRPQPEKLTSPQPHLPSPKLSSNSPLCPSFPFSVYRDPPFFQHLARRDSGTV